MLASKVEMNRFAARTPKSKDQFEQGKKYFPMGVTSNFRYYPPHPLYVREARGAHLWDLDGNEYVDFNMCFGVLLAGHANPKVVAAVQTHYPGLVPDSGCLASRAAKVFNSRDSRTSNPNNNLMDFGEIRKTSIPGIRIQ